MDTCVAVSNVKNAMWLPQSEPILLLFKQCLHAGFGCIQGFKLNFVDDERQNGKEKEDEPIKWI